MASCVICGILLPVTPRNRTPKYCGPTHARKGEYLKRIGLKISDLPDKCEACGKEIPLDHRKSSKRFCCTACYQGKQREAYAKQNQAPLQPTGTMGAIAELIVAVDLMRRGYDTYRALSPSSACDVAIVIGCNLLRVEVKTRRYTKPGKINLKPDPHQIGKHDVLAVYVPTTGEIIYQGLPDAPPKPGSEPVMPGGQAVFEDSP